MVFSFETANKSSEIYTLALDFPLVGEREWELSLSQMDQMTQIKELEDYLNNNVKNDTERASYKEGLVHFVNELKRSIVSNQKLSNVSGHGVYTSMSKDEKYQFQMDLSVPENHYFSRSEFSITSPHSSLPFFKLFLIWEHCTSYK